ncbi:MAG: glycosyltransferase family 39 protein [Planctomycetes bacterium]|nr:glycosyltransferase family 39 protein [Planctomycetota bacterium]
MSRRLLVAVATLIVLAAFAWLALARIPHEQILRYDEATHVHEGMVLRDELARGEFGDFVRRFDEQMTMKGILYRVYFAVAFLVSEVGTTSARHAGLIACLVALFLIGRLARELARDEDKDAAGFFAMLFAAASPLLGYWGRTAMVEPLNLLTLQLALWLCVRERRVKTRSALVWSVVGLVVAFFTKYNHAVILFAAVGADALLRVWKPDSAEATGKRRFAPALPLLIAGLIAAAWLASPRHFHDFVYYIKTVPGGSDPVNLGGWTYVITLRDRMGAGVVASLFLGACVVAALPHALRSRARLVLLHLGIGLGLAQMNDLKLERILVPLSGDLFVLAGLGAPRLWAFVTRFVRGMPAFVGVVLGILLATAFGVATFRVETNPLQQLEQVVDRGIDYVRAGQRTLWIGQAFFKGNEANGTPRITASHVVIRARERGVELPRTAFELLSYELQERLGYETYKRNADKVTKASVDAFITEFDSIVIVYDAPTKEPNLIETIPRRVAEFARANPAFELVDRVDLSLTDIEGPGRHVRCTVMRLARRGR